MESELKNLLFAANFDRRSGRRTISACGGTTCCGTTCGDQWRYQDMAKAGIACPRISLPAQIVSKLSRNWIFRAKTCKFVHLLALAQIFGYVTGGGTICGGTIGGGTTYGSTTWGGTTCGDTTCGGTTYCGTTCGVTNYIHTYQSRIVSGYITQSWGGSNLEKARSMPHLRMVDQWLVLWYPSHAYNSKLPYITVYVYRYCSRYAPNLVPLPFFCWACHSSNCHAFFVPAMWTVYYQGWGFQFNLIILLRFSNSLL